jgi:phosphate transport system ATP-binding protein
MHEVIPGAHCQGSIVVDGENLYGRGVDPVGVRRKIGMVFQKPNPFPTMSIYENVLAGVRLNNRRISRSDADALVERSLTGANLWQEVKDRLDRPGSGLSGGQQQRLCIARTIAVQPEIVLMDEPCSALDPISTLAIEDLIATLKNDYTIVIVTHNMQQAARVSDKTGFFTIAGAGKPGELVEYDATDKIFTNPTNKSTEDYVSGRFG